MIGAAATMSAPEPEITGGEEVRWWLLAACRDMDTALFFPDNEDGLPRAALLACEHCRVRSDCMEWALRHEGYGVWAGMSARHRERLRTLMGIRLDSPQSHVPVGALKATSDLPQVYVDDEPEEEDPWSWLN